MIIQQRNDCQSPSIMIIQQRNDCPISTYEWMTDAAGVASVDGECNINCIMGCVSTSQSFEPAQFENRAVVWLLGGGPGSPKHQVAEHLTLKFKFKYLSAMELLRFEETSGSPESSQICKALQEKTDLPTSLVFKVLQKVMVLYGPRKYLVDNFPRNINDANQFEALCMKYPQVRLQGYLHLQLQEGQMKESGMRALKELKKDASGQEIEREVRSRIENFRAKSKQIVQFYHSKGLLLTANFPNSDPTATIAQVETLLSKQRVRQVQKVPFFCLHGNEQAQIQRYGLRLARLFSLRFWSIAQLKEENSSRPEVAKYLAETKEEEISGQFLAELIQRKLERYNFKGKYLIAGFPRNSNDVACLRAKLNRQITITAYVASLRTPATQNENEEFDAMLRFFSAEQCHSVLLRSSEPSFSQVEAQLRPILQPITEGRARVVLCPIFEGEGEEHFRKMEEWCDVIDFQQIINLQIKKQKFASSLLASCVSLRKPLPSYIAANLFTEIVSGRQEGSKLLVIKGFPEEREQLKMVLSGSERIGVLWGMFVEASRIRKNIKSASESALAAYQKLCSALEAGCDKVLRVSQKTTYEEVKTTLTAP